MILSYDQRIMTGQYPVADLMGYRHTKDGQLVIEPEEAKTVRFIFLAFGYQGSTVLDEPEREAGTTSIPIPQREESENIPLPDLPGQLENVQQSGNEIAERGMPT